MIFTSFRDLFMKVVSAGKGDTSVCIRNEGAFQAERIKIALEASKVPAKLTQGLDRSSEDRESGDGLIAPPSTPVLKETFFSTWPEEVADETWEVKVGLPLRRQHGKVDLAGWVKAAMTDYHGATHTTERSPPVTPELEPASSTSDTTSSIGPIELAGNLPRRSRFYL